MANGENERIRVYHYTDSRNWNGIVRGSWRSENLPGLGANRRMGKVDSEALNTAAVFALLSPLPNTWMNNPYFSDYWKVMTGEIGNVLLEIQTNPQVDQVFVVDRGHIAGHLMNRAGIPSKYLHETRKEAERQYMLSKVPLRDYLATQESQRISLPEVVFTQNVPIDRIKVSEQQPILENYLKMPKDRNYAILNIVDGPMHNVLNAWRVGYEAANGPLGRPARSKELDNLF